MQVSTIGYCIVQILMKGNFDISDGFELDSQNFTHQKTKILKVVQHSQMYAEDSDHLSKYFLSNI